MVGQATVWRYKYAHAGGSELLHSTSFMRTRSRVSYNVLCQFWEGGVYEDLDGNVEECPTEYIGKINFFVKVAPPEGAENVEVLRLAVMDLHLVESVWTDLSKSRVGDFYQSSTYKAGLPHYANCAVSLSHQEGSWACLCCKLAMAIEGDMAFFMPYSNMSASGQDD